MNTEKPDEENVNERVHWSVMKKIGQKCSMLGVPNTPYRPSNLPTQISSEQIADITSEEQALLPGARP